jgi:Uncharacterised protein family UPF0547
MSEQTPETKVCPDCAEAVKAQARVCRFCGYRFDTSTEQAGASAPETIFARPTDRRGWFLLWGLTSALLMVFGVLGPWIRIGTLAGGGVAERHAGAVLVLVAAVIGGALLVVWRQRQAAGIAALLGGLVGLVVTVRDRRHFTGLLVGRHLVPGPPVLPRFVHVGWGLDLALLASLSLALCGLVWLIALRDDPPQTAPVVNATPQAR